MGRRLLLVLFVLLLTVPPAAALDCDMPTPERALAQADLVLVGQVVSEPFFMGAPKRKPYTIRVERVYKGTASTRVTLLHSPNIGPDIRLQKGQRYLLFMKWRIGEGFVTSSCMATRQLSGALPPEFAEALGPGWAPAGAAPGGAAVPVWLGLVGGAVLLAGAGVWAWRVLTSSRG